MFFHNFSVYYKQIMAQALSPNHHFYKNFLKIKETLDFSGFYIIIIVIVTINKRNCFFYEKQCERM